MPTPEELQSAADELPVAIWMGRVPSGEVVYTNRAFREVLGIEPPPGAARGAFVEPYGVHRLDGAPYPESEMPFERVLSARATVVVDDIVIHRRDGRRVNLRVFAKPLFDEAGEITHVLEAFTDITREVEAEQRRVEGERRLARAQRLESIGQLVTGIAHDFNNLLTVTKLAASLLVANEKDPAKLAAIRDVEKVTDTAIALVRSLLGFARRTKHPLAPLDLARVVGPVVDLARRTFDRRIALRAEIDGGSAWLRGDRVQLEQVLMNLLVNARDAVGESGSVVVRTSVRDLADGDVESCPAGRYVVLEVGDDGCGIDPAHRERVFEPYFTTKDFGPNKGTGLGLSTVHGIVRGHAGFIEAAAAAPRGPTRRIAIPACDPAPQEERAAEGPVPIPRGQGETILIAEDERIVRDATARALTALGYRVVEAETGEQAVAIFASRRDEIAAVVLDLVMPGLPARDVYAALRAVRADVPVLVVSGSATSDEPQALLEMGVAAWLTKPFDEAQIATTIRRLVALP